MRPPVSRCSRFYDSEERDIRAWKASVVYDSQQLTLENNAVLLRATHLSSNIAVYLPYTMPEFWDVRYPVGTEYREGRTNSSVLCKMIERDLKGAWRVSEGKGLVENAKRSDGGAVTFAYGWITQGCKAPQPRTILVRILIRELVKRAVFEVMDQGKLTDGS